MTLLTDRYQVQNYIDTFALGHYARVLAAIDQRTGETVAFKVMRPEHILADGDMRWEFRAFGNEVQILDALKTNPHVVKLRDCGFLSTIAEAPGDGEIVSFGQDVEGFNAAMAEYASQGWRPYMALEYLPRNNNLFYLMKPATPGQRRRLPTEEGISLALQFAGVMKQAHETHIVYLDHKLEHVYWDGYNLKIIDFNSSRQLTGATAESQEYIKDIHNLCVGILYPIFTGMSPQKTALRPQAGGMDVVEKRYEDVTELDFMVEPTLSYDLRELMQRGAEQQITHIDDFTIQIQEVAAQHGRDFPQAMSSPANRQARDTMRKGLTALRDGETKLREARDLLREVLIQDGISEDIENELRRLVKEINNQLNHRVIP